MRPLRILHISDLHERAEFDGMPPDRAPKILWDAEERGFVLGPRFMEALKFIARNGVDLVFLTGDVADWGNPVEYSAATRRLQAILNVVGVHKSRFFAVPGNHDVQRSVNRSAWEGLRRWCAASDDKLRLGRWFRHVGNAPPGVSEEWREQILERTSAFWNWMSAFGRSDLRPSAPKPLGYRHTIPAATFADIKVPIHVIGLDSAWLCGGDDDQGQILVTVEQVQGHIREGSRPLDGYRIALIHHPLDHLADHHPVRRILGDDGVDLLLHGHQHTPLAMVTDEPGARLRVIAAGCLMEGDLGKLWPNGFTLLEINVAGNSGAAHFQKWSRDGKFWAKGSDIYRDAPDGIFHWPRRGSHSSTATSTPLAPDIIDFPSVAGERGRAETLDSLLLFCGAGTAESESDIIGKTFVTTRDFVALVTPNLGSPRLIVGRKGSGKSAVLRYCRAQMEAVQVPAFLLTPSDLAPLGVEADRPTAEHKQEAYTKLIRYLAEFIADTTDAGLDLNQRQTLQQVASASVLSPLKLTKAIKLLAEAGKDTTHVNGAELFREAEGYLSESRSEVEALRRSMVGALKQTKRVVYMMMDDTDQLSKIDKPGYLNRFWGFILAARQLASECQNIRILITLRTEVWKRLGLDTRGQRDQMDHVRPLVKNLNPDNSSVGAILDKRLRLSEMHYERTSIRCAKHSTPMECFFEGDVKIPTAAEDERRSWRSFIVARSRSRPRDAIQLVAALAQEARNEQSTFIRSHHADSAMIPYSEGRVRDVDAEVGIECPNFGRIVESFAVPKLQFRMDAETVRSHLKKLPSQFSLSIGGIPLRPGEDEDVFRLWGLLYESGVLNARVEDESMPEGYRHLDPSRHSSFVAKSNWHEMGRVTWEINPAYRDYLLMRNREMGTANSFVFGELVKRNPDEVASPRPRRRRVPARNKGGE